MTKLSTLIAAGSVIVVGAATAAFAFASDTMTGNWNFQVGTSGPACVVTLSQGAAADTGDVASSASCPGGLTAVTYWHLNGTSLELKSGSGELVALLHKSGEGFAGSQIGGGRKVMLTRA